MIHKTFVIFDMYIYNNSSVVLSVCHVIQKPYQNTDGHPEGFVKNNLHAQPLPHLFQNFHLLPSSPLRPCSLLLPTRHQ
jgi:hypothetical protein